MKKNTFTIDLGNLELSEKKRKLILDAIHKAVAGKLKTRRKPSSSSRALPSAREVSGPATITATFKNTNPGLSELTATHKEEEKMLHQSGTLEFENVQRGDSIMIQGKSLGKAEISIDREAEPSEKECDPGTFHFNFFILQ